MELGSVRGKNLDFFRGLRLLILLGGVAGRHGGSPARTIRSLIETKLFLRSGNSSRRDTGSAKGLNISLTEKERVFGDIGKSLSDTRMKEHCCTSTTWERDHGVRKRKKRCKVRGRGRIGEMSSKELVKTRFFSTGHGVQLEGSMSYAKGRSWALLLSIYKWRRRSCGDSWSRQRAPLEQKAASCKHLLLSK